MLRVIAAALVALAAAQPATAASLDGDAAAEHYAIDKSTAADARQKIEAAGYAQVRNLRKGYDNFWHGKALKGSAEVNVVLTPAGKVLEEGD